MAVVIKGGVAGNNAEVELANLAMRVAPLPPDPGALGSYRKAMRSGTMAAGLGAAAPIFSFRYTGANLCVVRKVLVPFGVSTAFAAGFVAIDGFVARGFTAPDTGGTAGTLTVNNAKLRTSYATTGLGNFMIAGTGTLAAGTRTLDTDPFATMVFTALPATATSPAPQASEFYRATGGEETLTLATNEGFVLQATVPATGTWMFGVDVTWIERAAWV